MTQVARLWRKTNVCCWVFDKAPAGRPMPFTFWEKPAVNSPFRATLRGFRCKSSGAKRSGVRPLEAAIDERQRRQAPALQSASRRFM